MYWVTGILAIVSAAAPFVFNYSQNTAALWTSLGVGGMLMLTSLFEGAAQEKENWEYWVAGIVGLGAIAAPFVFNFSGIGSAVWTMIAVGIITVLVSGTEIFSDKVSLG